MKHLILSACFLFSTVSFAGPGTGHSHGHGHSHSKPAVAKEKTEEIGKSHIARLIKAGKLDAGWSEARLDSTEQKEFGKKKEWVLTFINEKDAKNPKLFIFLKLSGDFIAANFTGK